MHSVSVQDAKEHLSEYLKRAIAGEEIGIEDDNVVVALKPLRGNGAQKAEALQALEWLQKNSGLSGEQAEAYCEQVRQERRAWSR